MTQAGAPNAGAAIGGMTGEDLASEGLASDPSADEAGLWATLADPVAPAAFHAAWLALLCRRIPRAESGLLVLRQRDDGRLAPAALWPSLRQDVRALAETAEAAVRAREPVLQQVTTERGTALAMAYPLRGPVEVDGVAVVVTAASGSAEIAAVMRAVHWAAGLIEAAVLRAAAMADDQRLAASRQAFDIVAATQDEATLDKACLRLVNELAVCCRARRVALGLRRGHHARMKALSNSSRFDRRSDLVQHLELAMDECLVQGETVRLPAAPGGRRQITAAHQPLVGTAGAAAVVSVPLLAASREPFGVLTIELAEAQTDKIEEVIVTAELIAALLTPYLSALAGTERWVSGRLPALASRAAHATLGRGHAGTKLALAAAGAALLFLAVAPMPFWITARAVVEGEIQRAAVAPFDGFVLRAAVRAGDRVEEGQELASLDDRDLRFDRLKWESEKQKLEQRQREAMAKFDRAAIQVLAAQIDQAEAELKLVDEKLRRARIVAPISGYVVSGDLSQLLGSPVQTGKVLFEIAPLSAFRVALAVDEADIRLVREGMTAALTLTGAGEPVPVVVNRSTAVATVKDGRNTFRVEGQIGTSQVPVRPGMEGVVKIAAGEAPLLWTWSRSLIDRTRLFIWAWMP